MAGSEITTKDPVCGMTANPETARGGSFEHGADPMIASAAMAVSSVSVIANALHLRTAQL